MYKKITAQIEKKLSAIVGSDHILTQDYLIEKYSEDETSELKYFPDVVVLPRTTGEIEKILLLANEEMFPVTPRGTGTGVTGGALPLHGGLVLSLERMNNILEIDRENMVVVTEPGVITGDLHAAVESEQLFYPPDPNSLENCSIGGNVAENAGGPRAVKYGVTKDYILGMEAILPTGSVINCGGKLVKDVTGYNLSGLITGSEGTLAVITKVLLDLKNKPSERIDLLVPFDTLRNAVQTVVTILQKHLAPAVIEFMDNNAIAITEQYLDREMPFNKAAAHLLIELDGDKNDDVEMMAERIGEVCLEHGAMDVLVADNSQTREKIWEVRRKMRDAMKAVSPKKFAEDVVVPRIKIPELTDSIHAIAQEYAITNVNYGHAGDGNIHVNFLKMDMDDTTWYDIKPRIIKRLFEIVVKMGGSISGEHGIGIAKKEYLHLALSQVHIESMRKIKKSMDPQNILNPGKIFN